MSKIKPKKAKPVAGAFALPPTMTAGTYRVLACADTGNQVKERKETSTCKASKGSITVVVTVAVTVSASAGTGGTVAASAISGATCAGTTCTFPNLGTGTVTFTPTPSSGPATDKDCTATFGP